jgi:osmoprotectant transport system permease protein
MNLDWLYRESGWIADLVLWHLGLAVIPLILGLAIALPLGGLAHKAGSFRSAWLGFAGLFYTIPSLALLVLLPLLLRTHILDPINVVVALTIYAVALLVRTVADGLATVPVETLAAASALGYRPLARFLFVELPLAVPAIMAGLRVAAVSNISMVSVAAVIGTPQLGLLFTQGLQLNFLTPVVAGIALCLVLAALLDWLVVLLGRRLAPWHARS